MWAPSPFTIACLARDLCAIERAWRRHTIRCCSGEDGGYTKRIAKIDGTPGSYVGRSVVVHDLEAEARADARLRKRVAAWCERVPGAIVELEGDPRGTVLKLKLPGMAEAVAV